MRWGRRRDRSTEITGDGDEQLAGTEAVQEPGPLAPPSPEQGEPTPEQDPYDEPAEADEPADGPTPRATVEPEHTDSAPRETPTRDAPDAGTSTDLVVHPSPDEERPTAPRRPRRPRPLARGGVLLVLPAVLLLLVVTVWPLGRAVLESSFRSSLLTPDDRTFVALDTYASVLSSGTWWAAVGLTMLLVVVAVTTQLALAALFATTLRRLTRGTRWLQVLLLVPFGLLSVVAATGWRDALTTGFGPAWFGYDGETTTVALVAILASEVWRGTGITTLILLAGLSRVSPALLEASLADGANAWQRFWRVTRPAAAPAIAVAVVYRSLDAVRALEAPLLVADDAARPVSLLTWSSTFEAFELGLGATLSVLVLVLAGLVGLLLALALRVRRVL